jgi:enoyl-CoA hydratase
MSQPQVHTRRDPFAAGHAAWISLDDAAKLNALSPAMMDAFLTAMADECAQPGLRVIILSGAGSKAFVGGADIDALAGIDSPQAARAFITQVHRCCAAVRDAPVPVIAAIGGWCLGAGLELAAACDLRIAEETAKFGMPEVKLGVPSVVEAALLPGLIGWARTRELLLFGGTIDARRALHIGLVDELVLRGGLDEAVAERLSDLAACQPNAVRLQKALIRRWEDLPVSAAITAGIDAFAAAFETDEPGAALAQFQARRGERKAAR